MATTMQVAADNGEQARAWNGDEGSFWAANAEHFDRSVAAYHRELLEAARLDRADRILDVGCGTGQTTRDAARLASAGSVLGIDLSEQMIALARRIADADGPANARFECGDVQVYPFAPASFDAAISRTGTMFFADPVAAFANIATAVRSRGRLTMLVWQAPERNEWIGALVTALAAGRDLPVPPAGVPGPFAFAAPDRTRDVLTASGFTDITVDGAARPMWFGTDVDDAHRFVTGLMGWLLAGLDESGRARAEDSLRATLAAHATGDGVLFESATWTVAARRR
jgi:SAM-dependent methyltransferase